MEQQWKKIDWFLLLFLSRGDLDETITNIRGAIDAKSCQMMLGSGAQTPACVDTNSSLWAYNLFPHIVSKKLVFFEFGNCSKFNLLFKYLKFLLNQLILCSGNYSREEQFKCKTIFLLKNKSTHQVKMSCMIVWSYNYTPYNSIWTCLLRKWPK